MKTVADERLIYEILSVVEEISCGKVASYVQIARLIGREKNARLVGRVLKYSDRFGEYPCHRVVNSVGGLAPGFLSKESFFWTKEWNFCRTGAWT